MKKSKNKKKKSYKGLFVLFLLAAVFVTISQLITRQNFLGKAQTTSVIPSVETDAFSGSGDIADDSAIWFNETSPAQSVIIGDNKDTNGGLGVFDLSGKQIQFLSAGKIGNVDLRTGFPLGSENIILVGANNRSNSTIALYKLDPSTRQLSAISGSRPTLNPNYGFCLYKSPTSQKYYAFVTQEVGSGMEQYELVVSGTSVNATKVRTLNVGSQSEGCVADDAKKVLYVGEEDQGIWKYGAEPTDPTTRTAVDSVSSGHLTADVEGLAIAYVNGAGYLFASSQGDSRFAVYSLDTGAFVKNFTIGANGAIDAVSETDGISVSAGNFNATFPNGLFVAHDASNSNGATSNLKFVPLHLILGTNGVGPSTGPTLITPSMYCLGPCPTAPQPTSQIPGMTQSPSTPVAPTVSESPCDNQTASIAHKKHKKSKHKHKGEGYISKLMKFLMQLLTLLFQLFGDGKQLPNIAPVEPTQPITSEEPVPSVDPC